MKFRRLLLAGLVAGHTLPAFGECDDKRSALSDFGLAALGDSGDKLPRDIRRLPNCEIYEGKFADCGLLDKSGVRYLVFENIVNRKDVLIHRTARPPLLPFGLKPTDKIADVVKKITPRKDAPDFYILYRGGKIELFSGICVTNARGAKFAVEFTFTPDETLEQMSVLLDSPAN